ncbi:MAG TPA: TonB-dependent receptor [Gammaproteobacteria bacterium]|nr:TonB-dependent receptor [Gammaproteobacteria bacterium]
MIRTHRSSLLALGAAASLVWVSRAPAQEQEAKGLLEMSIEELGRVPVTSVSRREESLKDAAAAAFVITGDEIRRSGVTTLADALRLAPGVEVARNGSHSWTISIRGFNSNLSDKLLVLVDGRSVYSPLYAGVFWDVQDTLLDDIDRIEVIAGPGGTLWGANAVNGVINIITRSAWETRGGYLKLAGGGEERGTAGLRYGTTLGDSGAIRGFVKYFDRDASVRASGADDGWHMARGGFRADFDASDTDTVTLEGEVYSGKESDLLRGDFTLGTLPTFAEGTIDVGGSYVLGRWHRRLHLGAEMALQVYYDHTERDIPGSFEERRDTLNADFQHNLKLIGRHNLIWGAGIRSTGDDIGNTFFSTFEPASRTDQTYSAFLQDKIELAPRKLFLILGTKLEHNDYTGFENQPSVRMAWLRTQRQTLWAAVSRAVRIPARIEHDLRLTSPVDLPNLPLPLYVEVSGNPDFLAEKVLAYEIGYRIAVGEQLSFDVSVFDNDYDRLLTNDALAPTVVPAAPEPYIVLPIVLANGGQGRTWGSTFAARWRPLDAVSLQFQYSRLEFDLHNKPGHSGRDMTTISGNSPEDQAAVYSFVDLTHRLSFYGGLRYVGELPAQGVPSYTAFDASLAWRPNSRIRAALTVQNLNDDQHAEFGDGGQIERSAYAEVDWTF